GDPPFSVTSAASSPATESIAISRRLTGPPAVWLVNVTVPASRTSGAPEAVVAIAAVHSTPEKSIATSCTVATATCATKVYGPATEPADAMARLSWVSLISALVSGVPPGHATEGLALQVAGILICPVVNSATTEATVPSVSGSGSNQI